MKKITHFTFLLFITIATNAQRPIWPVDTTEIQWKRTFDFEQGVNSEAASIWQFGQPSKTIFNSAFSGNRALITDSSNLLSGKKKDGFQLKFSIMNDMHSGNFHIGFRHRFDFDSLSGGIIRISTDNGKTFSNIWNDTACSCIAWWHSNLYPNNSKIWNGESGFKGQSKDWIYTQINLTYFILVKTTPDTIIISFDYESDSLSVPHEGWEIDDIKTGGEWRSGGIGDSHLLNEINIYPNPSKGTLIIDSKILGAQRIIRYKIWNVSGELIQSNILLPQELNYLSMEGVSSGIYFIEIEGSGGEKVVKKFILN